MTQEEKLLLLKDLSARLPYGIMVQVKDWTTLDTELKTGHIRLLQDDKIELMPYLRPMSSMTKKEKKEIEASFSPTGQELFSLPYVDYLNSIHVDYRGLIPKGLALEAPKGMYNIKTGIV